MKTWYKESLFDKALEKSTSVLGGITIVAAIIGGSAYALKMATDKKAGKGVKNPFKGGLKNIFKKTSSKDISREDVFEEDDDDEE